MPSLARLSILGEGKEDLLQLKISDPGDIERFRSAASILKSRLVMKQWLKKHKWRFVYDEVVKVGVNSLQDLARYAEDDEAKINMLSNFQASEVKPSGTVSSSHYSHLCKGPLHQPKRFNVHG